MKTLTSPARTRTSVLMTAKLKRTSGMDTSPSTLGMLRWKRLGSFKFLCVHITDDLSRTLHTDTMVKKAHQWLCFMRRMSKFGINARILTNFYRCTIESLLMGCITVWYRNCSTHSKSLQSDEIFEPNQMRHYLENYVFLWV